MSDETTTTADPVADLLRLDDGTVGALVVSTMSWLPPREAFAALGRLVRSGDRADVEALLLRKRGKR